MAKEEWQEETEQENKKKVELAIKEHQLIWEKRYKTNQISGKGRHSLTQIPECTFTL